MNWLKLWLSSKTCHISTMMCILKTFIKRLRFHRRKMWHESRTESNMSWMLPDKERAVTGGGGYSVDFIFYCVAFPQCDSVSRWFLLQPQPLQVSEGTGCVLAVSSTPQRRINKWRLAFAGFTASPASENTGETIKPSGNPNQIVWKAIESVKMSRFFTSTNVLGLIAAVVIIIRQRQPQQSQVINHPFWNSYKWTYTIRIWSLVTNRFMDNEGSLKILVVISNIWNRKQMELASCQRPDESVWCPSVRIEQFIGKQAEQTHQLLSHNPQSKTKLCWTLAHPQPLANKKATIPVE